MPGNAFFNLLAAASNFAVGNPNVSIECYHWQNDPQSPERFEEVITELRKGDSRAQISDIKYYGGDVPGADKLGLHALGCKDGEIRNCMVAQSMKA